MPLQFRIFRRVLRSMPARHFQSLKWIRRLRQLLDGFRLFLGSQSVLSCPNKCDEFLEYVEYVRCDVGGCGHYCWMRHASAQCRRGSEERPRLCAVELAVPAKHDYCKQAFESRRFIQPNNTSRHVSRSGVATSGKSKTWLRQSYRDGDDPTAHNFGRCAWKPFCLSVSC